MNLKYIIFIIFIILGLSSAMNDIDEMFLQFFTQIESVKKSIDILKVRVDVLNDRNQMTNCCAIDKQFSSMVLENFDVLKNSLNDLNTRNNGNSDNDNAKYQELHNRMTNFEEHQKTLVKELTDIKEKYSTLLSDLNMVKISEQNFKQKTVDLETKLNDTLEKYKNTNKENEDLKLKVLSDKLAQILAKEEEIEKYHNKTIFDVRVDKIPEFKKYCHEDPAPMDCKTATKCTQKSGYYKIFLPNNKSKEIMVFCDMETFGGGWLHILRRKDGSENFTRPWLDYVNGFGNIDGEYWLGLENIHVLTKKIGQQQLYVHIEDFEGNTYFALYDNFVVDNANEFYALKSLGNYYGMGEDDMSYNVGSKFSTIDKDNDSWDTGSCAIERQTGWWYNRCTYVQPTGHYLRGKSSRNSVFWGSFHGLGYSHKVMYLMIKNK